MSFWIATDVCCDLPVSYIKKQERFLVAPMAYQMDSQAVEIDPYDEDADSTMHAFYQKLVAGSIATTSQVTLQTWLDLLTPVCEEGNDILILTFSSALSGTFNAASTIAKELSIKYENRKIRVVDTLCASLGQGMLVQQVIAQRDSGKNLEECLQYALENIQRTIHWFTVNDLHFLRRGGRVSVASAYIGSILKIKPVLNVSPDGKLIAREKVQGRKQSLRALVEKAREYALEPDKQTMYISHGDSLSDATWLAGKLKDELNVPEVVIGMVGPIIGSHSGPGTIALFFTGKDGAGRLTPSEE